MSKEFTIIIPGVNSKVRLLVNHITDRYTAHRFHVSGKNGDTLIFDKNEGTWLQSGGKMPQTKTAELHVKNIIDQLERYLRARNPRR